MPGCAAFAIVPRESRSSKTFALGNLESPSDRVRHEALLDLIALAPANLFDAADVARVAALARDPKTPATLAPGLVVLLAAIRDPGVRGRTRHGAAERSGSADARGPRPACSASAAARRPWPRSARRSAIARSRCDSPRSARSTASARPETSPWEREHDAEPHLPHPAAIRSRRTRTRVRAARPRPRSRRLVISRAMTSTASPTRSPAAEPPPSARATRATGSRHSAGAGSMSGAGDLPLGIFESSARGVSGDGNIIVGLGNGNDRHSGLPLRRLRRGDDRSRLLVGGRHERGLRRLG